MLNSNYKLETSHDKANPEHYKNYSMEVIDMMEAIWGKDGVVLFCEMNSFKYRMRAGTKQGEFADEDLRKAFWYENKRRDLMKLIQEEEDEVIF